ncbi:MAG TPA: glutamine--tRNA ligase/YqeY domain fusion protein [Vicinamibacterales bacterium]|nr:glutamine--tRNA ligase/YqeY domain fusion protein [Vicinamibacterales bacterium]
MPTPSADSRPEAPPRDFIREIVSQDLMSGKYGGRVVTRFPPEPNGSLHIGHAKAICIDFGVAQEFGGRCNLRFDDTNPVKESQEYVDQIVRDIRWLGFDWGEHLYYASDYFERLYEWAEQLIKAGKAYVDSLTADQIREYRGTLTEPGRDSPYRTRSVEENLDLFRRMRSGEFEDGAHVLRARIDMASGNINLRDPVMYRIRNTPHQRTGDAWCIYPMYDWAHGQSDSIERVTHSLCSLEYEDHRPLYDWYLDALGIYHSQQIEFARLNLSYTVMSKRTLLELVEGKHVSGWDDPRMPTLSGLRRRGYTPESIRNFCDRIGVAKRANVVDIANLEHAIREDLNVRAPRVMGVLNPLKVVIENYAEGQSEDVDVINNPEDPAAGTRKVPFGRVLYIERDDFMEVPPKKFFRLSPGKEVRLRCAYFVKCTGVVKDPATGDVIELRCTYDPATRGGDSPDGRKVKATLHWVSAEHALPAEVRLYDRLFTVEDPADSDDYLANLNPHSLEVIRTAKVEPSLARAAHGRSFQFERIGYFCVDPDSSADNLVFNRTVSLRDTWAKIAARNP